jgi:chitodextrinase
LWVIAIVFLIVLPNSAFAYAGGLLNGKTLNYGNVSSGTNNGSTNLLTNGVLTDAFTLTNYSGSASYVYYDFPGNGVTLTDYQLFDSTGSTNKPYLRAWDSSGAMVLNTTGANVVNNGTKTSLTPVNVKKVALVNQYADVTVNLTEFDVFGTLIPDTTPPVVPTGLTANVTNDGSGQAVLSWNAVSDSDLATYKIYKDSVFLAEVNKPSTSYNATGLIVGTAYAFQVSAIDKTGNESAKSALLSVTTGDHFPPATPTGLIGTDGGGKAIINWSSNTESDLAGYNLYYEGVKVNTTGLITGTTATIEGLTPGQVYSYQLSAVDNAGNESTKSAAISVLISNPLSVNFIPNMDSIVLHVIGGSPPYTVTWPSGTESFNSTSYTISGLLQDTNYSITVSDTAGTTFVQTINTGNLKAFVPPLMPNPVSMFQKMIDNFGGAGTVAIAIIGSAVALGVIVILGMYGWRLTKKWLSTTK